MNQLFQQLAAPTSPMASGNANGLPPMFGMLQKFMDFKNSFKGNAKEQVQIGEDVTGTIPTAQQNG